MSRLAKAFIKANSVEALVVLSATSVEIRTLFLACRLCELRYVDMLIKTACVL